MRFNGLEKGHVFGLLKKDLLSDANWQTSLEFKKAVFIACVCTDAFGLNFFKSTYLEKEELGVLFAPGKNNHNVYTYGTFVMHVPTVDFRGWTEKEIEQAESLYSEAISLKYEDQSKGKEILEKCAELFCRVAQKFENGITLMLGPTYEGGLLSPTGKVDHLGNLALIHHATETAKDSTTLSWIPLIAIIEKCQRISKVDDAYKEFIKRISNSATIKNLISLNWGPEYHTEQTSIEQTVPIS